MEDYPQAPHPKEEAIRPADRHLMILALGLALLVSACRPTSSIGTLKGQFEVSGAPVGYGAVFLVPTAGTVTVFQTSGRLEAALQVGASGLFTARLRSGTYILKGASVRSPGSTCATAKVAVRPRATTLVRLFCVGPLK